MRWMTAEEALAILGTKPQSLYASVSRGRIRARPDPQNPRRNLYHGEDVHRIARARAGARRAADIAARTIDWGVPILETALSTVVDGRLYYRGVDAGAFSAHATVEDAAALLWDAPWPEAPVAARRTAARDAGGIAPAFRVLAGQVAGGLPSVGRSVSSLRREAGHTLLLLYEAVLSGELSVRPLHRAVAEAWRCPQAADAIRRCLVLLADHELNASTFAVRVAASTGAPLAAAVLAGLSALSGPRHGGAPAQVAALLETARAAGPEDALRRYLQEGRPVPGFGHKLYAEGDIRAKILLERIEIPPSCRRLMLAAEEILGERPNIDFALAAVSQAQGLPEDAPLMLFALGRAVGWLAHALEQAQTGTLIRPRARYVGPPPAKDGAGAR